MVALCEGVPQTGERTHPSRSLRPFLRWAGGKQQILPQLRQFVPGDVADRRYVEPFAGAAALFFALTPERAALSDANGHLIDCYRSVSESPETVSRYVDQYATMTSEPEYYRIRDKYNSGRPSPRQAARFIYLNKTCFNGIFRVNRFGKFNVPFGWKTPPALPTRDDLTSASKVLRRATLRTITFSAALQDAGEDDFVYLDPPYPPLNGTSYFTHYTAERFGDEDQAEVARMASDLDKRGALVMITNADTRRIRELYEGFHIRRLAVTRYVTCKSKKHRVSELVITNYRTRRRR